MNQDTNHKTGPTVEVNVTLPDSLIKHQKEMEEARAKREEALTEVQSMALDIAERFAEDFQKHMTRKQKPAYWRSQGANRKRKKKK